MPLPTFLPAYDTENPDCIRALPALIAMHEAFDMPATFFVVASLVDRYPDELVAMVGNHPLFEIASHSYTHPRLRDHRICGATTPGVDPKHELEGSKRRLEDAFKTTVTGFRTPFGFSDGLNEELYDICQGAGYRYSSSQLWGPDTTLPAPGGNPYRYSNGLWEIPGLGWHDNVTKGISPPSHAIQLFPSPIPEAALTRPVGSPAEEAELNQRLLQHAASQGHSHATLIYHPWSMGQFDPDMEMLRILFTDVRKEAFPTATFAEYVKGLGSHEWIVYNYK